MLRKFLKREDAVTATEYAVVVALIILACIVAVQALGDKSATTFDTISTDMDTMPGSEG